MPCKVLAILSQLVRRAQHPSALYCDGEGCQIRPALVTAVNKRISMLHLEVHKLIMRTRQNVFEKLIQRKASIGTIAVPLSFTLSWMSGRGKSHQSSVSTTSDNIYHGMKVLVFDAISLRECHIYFLNFLDAFSC